RDRRRQRLDRRHAGARRPRCGRDGRGPRRRARGPAPRPARAHPPPRHALPRPPPPPPPPGPGPAPLSGPGGRARGPRPRPPETTLASAGRTLPKPSADRWAMRADITPHPGFAAGRPAYAVAGNACYRAGPLRELGGFPAIGADDAGVGERARLRGYDFVWTP